MELKPNEKQIITALRNYRSGASRKTIMDMTGIPWSTLYDRLLNLHNHDIVSKITYPATGRGRRRVVWKLTNKGLQM